MDLTNRLDDEPTIYSETTTGSSTSSLTTTISLSEDADGLHLGAEANSFDLGDERKEQHLPHVTNNETSTKDRRHHRNSLIVMKELYTSLDSIETNHTYTTVSSVNDLLKAREYDACELLSELGFASSFEKGSKRDILSRFKPSRMLRDEDNRFLETGSRYLPLEDYEDREKLGYNESINKTEEWLQQHHAEDVTHSKSSSVKHDLGISEQRLSQLLKRPVLSKAKQLRKRFSKSRQSSFELLLPKLSEEDPSPEQGDYSTSRNAATSKPAAHTAIHESSTEHGSLNDVSADLTTSAEAAIPQRSSSPTAHERPQLRRHSDPTDKQVKRVEEDVKTEIVDDRRFLVPPSKTSLLQTTKVDSFELEEINSGTEDIVESHRQRRHGVSKLVRKDETSTKSDIQNRAASACSDDVSDENESSSGFDEDEAPKELYSNAQTPPDEGSCRSVEPHTVIQTIKTERFPGVADTLLIADRKTRYVYDVSLGTVPPIQEAPPPDSSSANETDNNIEMNSEAQTPLKKLPSFDCGSFPTQYIPLRCPAMTQRDRKATDSFIITPLTTSCDSNTPPGGKVEVGKSPRLMSDARRRRMEFAGRSALSGDSIAELYTSPSLVRHKGGFAFRKRRPGSFFYYKNAADMRKNETTQNDFLTEREVNKSQNEEQLPSSVSRPRESSLHMEAVGEVGGRSSIARTNSTAIYKTIENCSCDTNRNQCITSRKTYNMSVEPGYSSCSENGSNNNTIACATNKVSAKPQQQQFPLGTRFRKNSYSSSSACSS